MEQPWTILPSAKQRRFSGDKWENSKTAADNRSVNLNLWLHPSKPPRPHAAREVSKVLSSAVKIIEPLKQAELKIPPANDSYFPDLDAKVCSLPSCLHFCLLADSFYPSTQGCIFNNLCLCKCHTIGGMLSGVLNQVVFNLIFPFAF